MTKINLTDVSNSLAVAKFMNIDLPETASYIGQSDKEIMFKDKGKIIAIPNYCNLENLSEIYKEINPQLKKTNVELSEKLKEIWAKIKDYNRRTIQYFLSLIAEATNILKLA